MRIKTTAFVIVGLLVALTVGYFAAVAQTEDQKVEVGENEKLVILWTSGDREVAMSMIFMYAYNAPQYGWWDDITLIVWGPSAKLLCEDTELQEYVAKMAEVGITVKACKACADMFEVADKLTDLGIDVKYMGGELTDAIKGGNHVLTF